MTSLKKTVFVLLLAGFGALGFGFIELGGVTPRGQPGNPLDAASRFDRY